MRFIRFNLILFFSALLMLCVSSASAADYYISPNGNDSNSGTSQSAPLKTFNNAWQKIQPGDTLYLLDGTYTTANSGVLEVKDNGNPPSSQIMSSGLIITGSK